MFCKNCGKELKEGALFCSECGTKIEISNSGITAENSPVSKSDVSPSEQCKKVDNEKKFSFKIFPRGRSYILQIIKSFKGAYKVDFSVEKNRLLVIKTDNYGETVYSIPYYLISKFELKQSISVSFLFIYLICILLAVGLIITGESIGKGLVVLALICVFIYLYGFKKNIFSVLLNDGQQVKIKLMKISKKKKVEKDDFVNTVSYKIKNAVNTGDIFESAGTELTIGDIRNKISMEERRKLVDLIKNKH